MQLFLRSKAEKANLKYTVEGLEGRHLNDFATPFPKLLENCSILSRIISD